MSWMEGGGWGPLGDLLPSFQLISEAARESACIGLNFTKSTENLTAPGLPGGGGCGLHPRTVGLVERKDRKSYTCDLVWESRPLTWPLGAAPLPACLRLVFLWMGLDRGHVNW